jgi:predicted aldo/keto reductase-like oxidoreductase
MASHDTEQAKKAVKSMQMSLEQSLKALQTDYIDVMLAWRVVTVDQLFNEPVMEFMEKAKKSGKIRSFGFSTHTIPVEAVAENNKTRFFDVMMVPYNHKGSYTHTRYKRYDEWDQPKLEEELITAAQNGIGVVAMKTCSTVPYAPDENTTPTMLAGLQWILDHSFIHTMAVAMTNDDELAENLKLMG